MGCQRAGSRSDQATEIRTGPPGQPRERGLSEAQNLRLLQAVALGVVASLILFPLLGFPLARNLPFGNLSDALATAVLG